MIVPMTRLRIAVPRTRLGDLLRFVAEERLLHPADPTTDPYIDRRNKKSDSSSPASDHLAMAEKLRSMVDEGLNGLPKGEGERLACSYPGDDGTRWLASPLRERLEGVAGTVLKSVRAVARAQGELAEVASYLRLFMTFMPLLRTIGASNDMEAIGVVFHRGEEESARALSEALERVTDGAGVVLSTGETEDEGGGALLIFPRSLLGAVRGLAQESGVSPMKVPERYEEETFATTVARLYDVRAELTRRIEREREHLAMKGARWGAFLAEASAGLTHALAPLRAERHLLYDGELCWLTGWAPSERLASFQTALTTTLDGAVMIQKVANHPDGPEAAPVLLRNPRWASPFEQALALYALPRYGAFDPTTLAAFMFLFYFGMTLGDVGYGAVLLGFTFWAQRRWRDRPAVVGAARFGAIAGMVSIFFGGLYGEMFGPLWGTFGLPGPLFDRQHGADALLAATFVIGGIAVGGGVLLGARSAFRRGDRLEGFDRLADVVLVGALFMGGGLTYAGLSVEPAVVLAGGAFVAKLFVCRPIVNMLETPRLLSNVLSHARLMALGIAAVTLADLAHEMALMPESVIVGVLVGGTFHLLGFVIGVAGPTIHAGRLLFVEFFGQFYEAGGEPYAPLG